MSQEIVQVELILHCSGECQVSCILLRGEMPFPQLNNRGKNRAKQKQMIDIKEAIRIDDEDPKN